MKATAHALPHLVAKILGGALLLGSALSAAQIPSSGISAAAAAKLDAIAEQYRSAHRIPGLAVIVGTSSGRVLHATNIGFANLNARTAVSPETEFRIFSVSKVFAAVLVHQLAQEGRITLTAAVGQYMPELPAWRDSVKVRDLLAHTSGIGDFTDVSGWRKGAPTRAFVEAALRQPLQFAPGTSWRYSNTNFVLIDRLIERVTGESYASVLKRRLLVPSSLSSTSVTCGEPQLAAGYLDSSDAPVEDAVSNSAPFSLAVGGLCSTARDLYGFFSSLVSGRTLRPPSLAEMLRAAPVGIAQSGAGLFSAEDAEGTVISHSGASSNGTAEVIAFPRDSIVIVALANKGRQDLEELVRKLRRALLGIPEPVVLDLPIASGQLAPLVGTYSTVNGPGRMVVSERNGELYGLGTRLLYQGGGIFVPEDSPDLRLAFDVENGSVTGARVLRYGVVKLQSRRQAK